MPARRPDAWAGPTDNATTSADACAPEGASGEAPADHLIRAVEDLHRELEGLRASARLRAVIEQAKGVLVERHAISLDDAFSRLRTLSQEHNVRLVEVAATVVGVTLPDDVTEDAAVEAPLLGVTNATSPAWAAFRAQPDVRAKTASAVVHGVSSAVQEGDEAARVIRALAEPLGVEAVVLYRLAPDASLTLLGSDGYPRDLISAWRAIPPTVDVPMVRAVREVKPIFLRDEGERERQFSTVVSVLKKYQASASIPVLDGGQVVGTVGFGWPEPQVFDLDQTTAVEQLVRTAAPVLLRSARRSDPELVWVTAMLSLLFDPWLVLEPALGEDGEIRDFVVNLASAEIPDANRLLGRRLLELWPGLAGEGVFDELVRVADHGGMWDVALESAALGALPLTGPCTYVRAVRAAPRVVLHWRVAEP